MNKINKNQSFVSVALISTIGLFLTRIISVAYLIPFAAMVFNTNANYVNSYAYTMFQPFYELSLAGLPLAIARLISIYNVNGQYKTANEVLKIAQRLMLVLGLVLMVLFVLFAQPFGQFKAPDNPELAQATTLALYIMAPALVLIPILSGMRGYLQGFKTVIGVSISQVVERLAYVIILLSTLYITLNFFKIESGKAIAYAFIALPIATIITIFTLYPFYAKTRREHKILMETSLDQIGSDKKFISRQLILTALPFVISGLAATLYSQITLFTFEKIRIFAGATELLAKSEYTVINQWSDKLVSIPLTFSLAISVAIISFVTSAYESQDMRQTRKYVKKSYRMIFFTTLSAVLIMVTLSVPLITFFYNLDNVTTQFIAAVLRVDGFRGMAFALETISVSVLLAFGEKKKALIYSAIGPVVKLILNFPLVYFFGVYGDIFATMLGLLMIVYLSTRDILKLVDLKPYFIYNAIGKTIICSIPGFFLTLACNSLIMQFVPAVFEGRLLALIYLVLLGVINLAIIWLMSKKINFWHLVFRG
ncbi:polysaccharide biosynthesis protein [Erysipelotrichaceae bacterium]|nr:polysaccharide biosynthesis protein [Erysipelotrichaceae bacterium]